MKFITWLNWALVLAISGLALSTFVSGCGDSELGQSYSEQAARENEASSLPSQQANASQNDAPGPNDFAGVWQGSTLAICGGLTPLPGRCNAEQKVTITLLNDAGKLTGKYKCGYGNMDCYHENTTGEVTEVLTNSRRMTIRVQMPDGTSCIYTGMDVDQSVNGGYSCYAGGGQIEQGSWRARRSY
jgi:hypothetical protein